MEDVKPKYLKQTTTGHIYAYAPELAKRKDMVPVIEEKPAPEPEKEAGGEGQPAKAEKKSGANAKKG